MTVLRSITGYLCHEQHVVPYGQRHRVTAPWTKENIEVKVGDFDDFIQALREKLVAKIQKDGVPGSETQEGRHLSLIFTNGIPKHYNSDAVGVLLSQALGRPIPLDWRAKLVDSGPPWDHDFYTFDIDDEHRFMNHPNGRHVYLRLLTKANSDSAPKMLRDFPEKNVAGDCQCCNVQ